MCSIATKRDLTHDIYQCVRERFVCYSLSILLLSRRFLIGFRRPGNRWCHTACPGRETLFVPEAARSRENPWSIFHSHTAKSISLPGFQLTEWQGRVQPCRPTQSGPPNPQPPIYSKKKKRGVTCCCLLAKKFSRVNHPHHFLFKH